MSVKKFWQVDFELMLPKLQPVSRSCVSQQAIVFSLLVKAE